VLLQCLAYHSTAVEFRENGLYKGYHGPSLDFVNSTCNTTFLKLSSLFSKMNFRSRILLILLRLHPAPVAPCLPLKKHTHNEFLGRIDNHAPALVGMSLPRSSLPGAFSELDERDTCSNGAVQCGSTYCDKCSTCCGGTTCSTLTFGTCCTNGGSCWEGSNCWSQIGTTSWGCCPVGLTACWGPSLTCCWPGETCGSNGCAGSP